VLLQLQELVVAAVVMVPANLTLLEQVVQVVVEQLLVVELDVVQQILVVVEVLET
jgi:hypothetical protein